MMHESLDVIGPDEEIERAGKEFEAWRIVHQFNSMTFEQFIQIREPVRSNAWAYTSNRRGRTLISF